VLRDPLPDFTAWRCVPKSCHPRVTYPPSAATQFRSTGVDAPMCQDGCFRRRFVVGCGDR
jgi:hypothetical protein